MAQTPDADSPRRGFAPPSCSLRSLTGLRRGSSKLAGWVLLGAMGWDDSRRRPMCLGICGPGRITAAVPSSGAHVADWPGRLERSGMGEARGSTAARNRDRSPDDTSWAVSTRPARLAFMPTSTLPAAYKASPSHSAERPRTRRAPACAVVAVRASGRTTRVSSDRRSAGSVCLAGHKIALARKSS